MNTNYIKFALCINEDLLDRTNNISEGFNNYLSHLFEIYKPRIAYFADKIKIVTKKFFNLVLENISGFNNSENYNDNIYINIYNFLFKYHSKYKSNLFFKIFYNSKMNLKMILIILPKKVI